MNIRYIYFILGLIGALAGMYFYRYILNPSSKEKVSVQQNTYHSLWDAVMFGTYEDVEQCIAQGTSVTDYDSESALHAASQRGDLRIAQLLLKQGADIHAKSYEAGWTPLHQAACSGHIEIAQLFLSHGADVNEKSKPILQDVYDAQETALHVAARAGHLPMVQFLVEHDANVNAQCRETDACTPLHDAVRSGNIHIVAYLIDHGATAKDIPGAEPLLITACEHESNDMLELLVRHGYDINEQGKDGLTPLMMAIQNNRTEQVRYLLELHADTQLTDNQGYTALHHAAETGNMILAQLLVQNNADVNAPNWQNLSPFDIALEHMQEDMVGLFMQHGASVNECTIPDEDESDACQI